LAECLAKYHKEPEEVSKYKKILDRHFLFGFRGTNTKGKGFCWAIHTQGGYFVDGCNDGCGMFHAAAAGKMVIERLFAEYTDTIYCAYPTKETKAQRLCRRVGFKEIGKTQNLTIFSMQRG
jgi:hypothetical protein